MKTNQKGFAAVLAVLIVVVALAGAGAYFYVTQTAKQKTLLPQTSMQAATSDTANWQTYSNNEYGFELKYPADIKSNLNSLGGSLTLSSTKSIAINVSKESDPENCSFLARRNIESDLNVVVGGINFNKREGISYAGGSDGKGQDIYSVVDYSTTDAGKCVTVTFSVNQGKAGIIPSGAAGNEKYDINNEPEIKIFNQMLSTFKFTESSASNKDETYYWKPYENQKYEFSFKYPPDWIFDNSGNDWDFHLSNMNSTSDSLECEKGFAGLEIQIHSKKAGADLQCGEERASGKKENIKIGQNQGYKIEHGGWDASCDGPGYCIALGDTTYIWVFTGADSSAGYETINKIIGSIKQN